MQYKAFSILLTILSTLLFVAAPPSVRAAHMAHSRPEIHVGVVLFEGVEPIDYVGPYEVFAQAGFGVAMVTRDGKPVTGIGLTVTPDYSFASAPAFDVLLVPGGDVDAAMHDPEILKFIRDRSGSARYVMSVCTGTFVLAATGLLDGLKATTFHNSLKELAASYPKVTVLDDVRWADNGKLITSAGLASGIDTALHVVSRLKGEDVARSTALQLEYAWSPTGGFIRGVLADRYLPDLQHVAWPHDAHFEKLVSLGDDHQWRLRSRITSSTPPQDLLKLIDAAVSQAQGWTADPAKGPHHWRKQTSTGPVDLQFSSAASTVSGASEIEAQVVLVGSRS
jgi:putative intracellular protease/amidase